MWFDECCQGQQILILNAGSGGVDYGISAPMVHYDMIQLPTPLNGEFVQGNVEKMPFPNAHFGVVLCVGSVLNYCDPTRCLSEISRVLAPGGFAILEYERSASAEYVWQSGFGSGAARFVTFFGREKTYVWAYSDRFINAVIKINGLNTLNSKWFHCLSALALALTRQSDWAAHFTTFDRVAGKLPLFRAMASNRILVAKKVLQHT
jgi:SAM-dependent methyltransferase